MSSNWETYCAQSLGSCGCAVLHGATAYGQRPDLWSIPRTTAVELTSQLEGIVRDLSPRVRVWARAWIGGKGPVPLAAMSARNLAERMSDILGEPVRVEVVAGPADLFERPASKPQAHGTVPEVPTWPCTARDEAVTAKVPEHDCVRRREMLARREQEQ